MPYDKAIIAVVNLKGGVGKTAISVNLAAFLGKRGKKVLLIDTDPQTNATFSCMSEEEWKKYAVSNGTIADLFGQRKHANAMGTQKTPQTVIKREVFPKVDLLPSHLDLFTIDLDLAGATAREKILHKVLAPVIDEYDVVICDCPPNLTLPTQNALAISNHYLVPISPDYLSALGVGILISRIKSFSNDMELNLEFMGIVLSRVGRPAQHREGIIGALKKEFPAKIYETELKERVVVSTVAEQRKPIFELGDAAATHEWTQLFDEIISKYPALK